LTRTAPGRARLPIGELTLASGVPFALDAGGFNRHTFFCGQSGSGKTYSLGVVLEQLLLETGLRIVILDPNSDFARLHNARAEIDEPTTERRVHLRFDQLSREAQAALLQLDPVADREEYGELGALVDDVRPGSLQE